MPVIVVMLFDERCTKDGVCGMDALSCRVHGILPR